MSVRGQSIIANLRTINDLVLRFVFKEIFVFYSKRICLYLSRHGALHIINCLRMMSVTANNSITYQELAINCISLVTR